MYFWLVRILTLGLLVCGPMLDIVDKAFLLKLVPLPLFSFLSEISHLSLVTSIYCVAPFLHGNLTGRNHVLYKSTTACPVASTLRSWKVIYGLVQGNKKIINFLNWRSSSLTLRKKKSSLKINFLLFIQHGVFLQFSLTVE